MQGRQRDISKGNWKVQGISGKMENIGENLPVEQQPGFSKTRMQMTVGRPKDASSQADPCFP